MIQHNRYGLQEADRKELSLRAIIGLSPEQQGQIVGAAGQAEGQYQQAGHAVAGKAEEGAEAATAQVSIQMQPPYIACCCQCLLLALHASLAIGSVNVCSYNVL